MGPVLQRCASASALTEVVLCWLVCVGGTRACVIRGRICAPTWLDHLRHGTAQSKGKEEESSEDEVTIPAALAAPGPSRAAVPNGAVTPASTAASQAVVATAPHGAATAAAGGAVIRLQPQAVLPAIQVTNGAQPGGALSPRSKSKFSAQDMKQLQDGSLVCSRCSSRFSIFAAPDKCGQCEAIVCSRCSFSLPAVPALVKNPLLEPTVCTKCWPGLRNNIERVPGGTTATATVSFSNTLIQALGRGKAGLVWLCCVMGEALKEKWGFAQFG